MCVIAGFQGVDDGGQITTFGRGGSDTTAVAVAAALGADTCEIFTDTDGVFTTDPHLIPAPAGSKSSTTTRCSSSPRSAPRCSIPAASGTGAATASRCTSARRSASGPARSYPGGPRGGPDGHRSPRHRRGARRLEHARIDLLGVPDEPGVAARIFGALGAAGVSADMIIQGVRGAGDSRQQMAFTVPLDAAEEAMEAMAPLMRRARAAKPSSTSTSPSSSIVGIAIGSTPGVAGRMFEAVAAPAPTSR